MSLGHSVVGVEPSGGETSEQRVTQARVPVEVFTPLCRRHYARALWGGNPEPPTPNPELYRLLVEEEIDVPDTWHPSQGPDEFLAPLLVLEVHVVR